MTVFQEKSPFFKCNDAVFPADRFVSLNADVHDCCLFAYLGSFFVDHKFFARITAYQSDVDLWRYFKKNCSLIIRIIQKYCAILFFIISVGGFLKMLYGFLPLELAVFFCKRFFSEKSLVHRFYVLQRFYVKNASSAEHTVLPVHSSLLYSNFLYSD